MILGPCNVNMGPRIVITGLCNINMGPCILNRVPWKMIRGPVM